MWRVWFFLNTDLVQVAQRIGLLKLTMIMEPELHIQLRLRAKARSQGAVAHWFVEFKVKNLLQDLMVTSFKFLIYTN